MFLGGVLGGSNDASIVVKLDGDGQELWRWTSSYVDPNSIESLVIKEDGTIIAAGSYYPEDYDHYAVKLDADGGLVWQYTVRILSIHEGEGSTAIHKSVLMILVFCHRDTCVLGMRHLCTTLVESPPSRVALCCRLIYCRVLPNPSQVQQWQHVARTRYLEKKIQYSLERGEEYGKVRRTKNVLRSHGHSCRCFLMWAF